MDVFSLEFKTFLTLVCELMKSRASSFAYLSTSLSHLPSLFLSVITQRKRRKTKAVCNPCGQNL